MQVSTFVGTTIRLHNQCIHGTIIVEDIGFSIHEFKVALHVTGKKGDNYVHNLSALHKEWLFRLFEHAFNLVLHITSKLPTKAKKPITSVSQFPSNNCDHLNFFLRRVVPSKLGNYTMIQLKRKVRTASSLVTVKAEILVSSIHKY